MDEKQKIENTDKIDDTKKADNLESEAKVDKDKIVGSAANKFKGETLEDEVNEELDKRFLVKTIVDIKQQLQELKEKFKVSGDTFTDSESKTGKTEQKDGDMPDEKAKKLARLREKIKF